MDGLSVMPVTLSMVGVGVLGLGVILALLGLRLGAVNEETRRLERYVAEPAQAPETDADPFAFRQAELQGSFRQRQLMPWIKGLGSILGSRTPARTMASLSRQLAVAGNPLGLGPREFYGLQLIFIVLSLWAAFVIVRGGVAAPSVTPLAGSALATDQLTPSRPPLDLTRIVGAFLVVLIGTQFPKRWLRARVRGRQNRIRKNLPDALDMLSVCADAGLGFDQGLQRVSDRWKTPLGIEFARVVSEMQMGVGRQQALRNLAERLDVSELSSFVAIIIQSDQLGMSITNTLRAQAEQMRIERRHRAQEEARKVPLKMLFPMLIFIMPAIGAVIIGPIIPALQEVFSAITSNAR
jgi:tight adherence protein C